jgi:hypothetical protein
MIRINLPLFSTVVPAITFVLLSCRPFVVIITLSTGLVGVEITFIFLSIFLSVLIIIINIPICNRVNRNKLFILMWSWLENSSPGPRLEPRSQLWALVHFILSKVRNFLLLDPHPTSGSALVPFVRKENAYVLIIFVRGFYVKTRKGQLFMDMRFSDQQYVGPILVTWGKNFHMDQDSYWAPQTKHWAIPLRDGS